MSTPAVILAAGRSTRLHPLTERTPKSLLAIGNTSMMKRQLDALAACGVGEVIIVTGFEHEQLEFAVRAFAPSMKLVFIHNPDFATTNNAYSLMLAEQAIGGRRFLLLDSDLLYDFEVLHRMLETTGSSIALRRADDLGVEEVKLAMDASLGVTGIGKEVAIDAAAGESVGIEVFEPHHTVELFATIRHRMLTLGLVNEYYEASFQQMVEGGAQFVAVDIAPFRAMEVDTPADLAAAELAFGSRPVRATTRRPSQAFAVAEQAA